MQNSGRHLVHSLVQQNRKQVVFALTSKSQSKGQFGTNVWNLTCFVIWGTSFHLTSVAHCCFIFQELESHAAILI